MHEQEDDSLVTDHLATGSSGFSNGDHVGECQATQAQATDLQKIATAVAAMSVIIAQQRLVPATECQSTLILSEFIDPRHLRV